MCDKSFSLKNLICIFMVVVVLFCSAATFSYADVNDAYRSTWTFKKDTTYSSDSIWYKLLFDSNTLSSYQKLTSLATNWSFYLNGEPSFSYNSLAVQTAAYGQRNLIAYYIDSEEMVRSKVIAVADSRSIIWYYDSLVVTSTYLSSAQRQTLNYYMNNTGVQSYSISGYYFLKSPSAVESYTLYPGDVDIVNYQGNHHYTEITYDSYSKRIIATYDGGIEELYSNGQFSSPYAARIRVVTGSTTDYDVKFFIDDYLTKTSVNWGDTNNTPVIPDNPDIEIPDIGSGIDFDFKQLGKTLWSGAVSVVSVLYLILGFLPPAIVNILLGMLVVAAFIGFIKLIL